MKFDLSRIENIESCVIFKTIAGSHAYGLNTPDSDLDIRGVLIPKDKNYFYGFAKVFERYENKVNDTVIYNIRKLFNLMSDCNPNVIEFLYIEPRFHQKNTKYWEMVLEHREQFLSKRCRYSFFGYAFAQLKKIKNHRKYLLNPPKNKPERKDFGLTEHIRDVSKDQINAFKAILGSVLHNDGINALNLSQETTEELKQVKFTDHFQNRLNVSVLQKDIQEIIPSTNMNWLDVMHREQAYENAHKEWEAYQNWKKNRNPKRAVLEEKYGFDGKHCIHLIRLLRSGKEILEKGTLTVYREDREELLAIKNGAWPYEKILEYAEKAEQEIDALYKQSKLRNKPDINFLDDLCVNIIDKFLMENT